jgi:formylglycine-generating enzyme required for sulfatase activity
MPLIILSVLSFKAMKRMLSYSPAILLAGLIGISAPGTSAAEPGRWAILIGVNDYAHLEDLRFTSQDTEALSERLIASGFSARQITVLRDGVTDSKYLPIKANIEKQLEVVLGLTEPNDVVLLSFSGHGVHINGTSYLCPAEADVEKPEETMLRVDAVYKLLEKSRAATKLLVLDACRNDPRPLGKRSATPQEDNQRLAEALERSPHGICLLSSCGAGQVSYEDADLKHGVFMHYLLQGLRGRADSNRNGKVSLEEIYEYANRETKVHVHNKWSDSQVPVKKMDLDDNFEFSYGLSNRPVQSGRAISNSIGMKLVEIPAGDFHMGSPEHELGRSPDEYLHHVVLTRPFYIGMYEVTQAEYRQVMRSDPPGIRRDPRGLRWDFSPRSPAFAMTWHEAKEFCQRLSSQPAEVQARRKYRLPSEAEWEYACRAGTVSAYYLGDKASDLAKAGWFGAKSGVGNTNNDFPHAVGGLPPNGFGLYDMHGNVWEWCEDFYAENFYAVSPEKDPKGPSAFGPTTPRVVRGGGFQNSAASCRSAKRYTALPDASGLSTGFRVVCEFH